MLVIRLARGGRSKYPTYRIVAAESARAATGKYVEVLGHYNPHTKELVIKKEETLKRLNNGAQPSNSVIKLLQREKLELPKWVKLETKTRKPKNPPAEEIPKAEVAPEESKAEEVVEEAAETPAEESEQRVAEAATANAEAVEEQAPSKDTETAEDTEKAAEAAEKANDAGAEAADDAAKEEQS